MTDTPTERDELRQAQAELAGVESELAFAKDRLAKTPPLPEPRPAHRDLAGVDLDLRTVDAYGRRAHPEIGSAHPA